MKYYKLDNAKVTEAKNKKPLECYYADGEFSYYLSESGETLSIPFILLQEDELPPEFIARLRETLQVRIDAELDTAKALTHEAITSFSSAALGQVCVYDMEEIDQLNLIHAIRSLQEQTDPAATASIRCSDENGIKDNRPHTLEQLKELYVEWNTQRQTISDAYSKLKLDLAAVKSEIEITEAVGRFRLTVGK